MPSKIIRLNPNQIRYLKNLLERDSEFCKKEAVGTDDIFVKDYLNFEYEVCESIRSKLSD